MRITARVYGRTSHCANVRACVCVCARMRVRASPYVRASEFVYTPVCLFM